MMNEPPLHEHESEAYAYARHLVRSYFYMMTVGCGEPSCRNGHCRSNSVAGAGLTALTANEAAAKSIVLVATQSAVPLCTNSTRKSHVAVDMIGLQHSFPDERPEVDEDEDQDQDQNETAEETAAAAAPLLACSPRRRLSDAVQLDSSFNESDSSRDGDQEQEEQVDLLRLRRASLPKQKLLDAIRRSGPTAQQQQQRRHELETTKNN